MPLPSQNSVRPIRLLRYTLRCLNGHEIPYDTSEWPGLLPVHCQVDGCGFHVSAFPVGEPEVVNPDVFGRKVCPYCADLLVSDSDKWEFCCGAQEEDAQREWARRHA